jgi:hypothetical protein
LNMINDSYSQESIHAFQNALKVNIEYNHISAEKASTNLNLLSNAFAFGMSDMAVLFLWDLGSYSSEDDSYDIYCLQLNSIKSYFLGRSFFEFVSEFCVGKRISQIIPEGELFHPDEIVPVFRRFDEELAW